MGCAHVGRNTRVPWKKLWAVSQAAPYVPCPWEIVTLNGPLFPQSLREDSFWPAVSSSSLDALRFHSSGPKNECLRQPRQLARKSQSLTQASYPTWFLGMLRPAEPSSWVWKRAASEGKKEREPSMDFLRQLLFCSAGAQDTC